MSGEKAVRVRVDKDNWLGFPADTFEVDDDGRLWVRDAGRAVAVFTEWQNAHLVIEFAPGG